MVANPQFDNYIKQLEKTYQGIFGVISKIVSAGDNTQRTTAVNELGSRIDEFETICDELCFLIEYNKQRLKANVITNVETNADISILLNNKLETTKRLKQLLEDFTKELQPEI